MDWTAIGLAEHEANALQLLERHWGYKSFQPGQWEAIAALIAGRDVVAVLPTGGGKSLIYQLAGLLMRRPVLVVSPLIALMQDQVEALAARGLSATWLSALLSPEERRLRIGQLAGGKFQFVYVSPERLKQQAFRAILRQLNPGLLAIDEAHCVVEWGHEFRPSYRCLASLRLMLPNIPAVALSATLSRDQAPETIQLLGLNRPELIRTSIGRPNLNFELWHTESPRKQTLRLCQELRGSGLVYVRRRLAAQHYAQALQNAGVAAACYHGRMPANERESILRNWLANRFQVVVATEAFGMGIDKPDVRWIIHPDLPNSLEAYWQEAGRAGRDGLPARCLLLVSRFQLRRARRLLVEPWLPVDELWPQLNWSNPADGVWITPAGRLIGKWLVETQIWPKANYRPFSYQLQIKLDREQWPPHWQHLAASLPGPASLVGSPELSLTLGASGKGLRSVIKSAAREGLLDWTELPPAWMCLQPQRPSAPQLLELKYRYDTYQQRKINSWQKLLKLFDDKRPVHQVLEQELI